MTIFVDTSVWSLVFRRDLVPNTPQVQFLLQALKQEIQVVATGIILQELLQGFSGPKANDVIIERFKAIAFVNPDRQDYISAAALRNRCRKVGIQVGTIDALIAQLCLRHDLTLLTTDLDFKHLQRSERRLNLWRQST